MGILHSPWAEVNQESGDSEEDHDDQDDVGAVFFSGKSQALFKRAGHRGHGVYLVSRILRVSPVRFLLKMWRLKTAVTLPGSSVYACSSVEIPMERNCEPFFAALPLIMFEVHGYRYTAHQSYLSLPYPLSPGLDFHAS